MKFVMRRRASATRLLAVFIVASAAVIGVPALTAPAQAYPTVSCSVSGPTHPLKPGQRFTVRGKSPIVERWTVAFEGDTRKFHAKSFATSFTAPQSGNAKVVVTCSGPDGALTQSITIHVLTAGNGGGKLPNTGGPDLWWFVAAGGAIAGGVVLLSRRRRTS